MGLQNKDKIQGNYHLLDKNKNKEPLKKLDVSEGSETLGIYIAMNGNNVDQRKNLENKAKKMADQLCTKICEPNTSTYVFNSCFMASIRYCLPVSNFTEAE